MQKVWHAEMSQDIKQKARACLHFKPNFQFSPLYLSSSSPKLEINRSERRHSKGDGERERGKVHIEGFMKYFLDANELHILLMLEMLQKKYVCVCRIEREIERDGKWFVLYRTGSCDAPDWHSTMKQETEKKKKKTLPVKMSLSPSYHSNQFRRISHSLHDRMKNCAPSFGR